MTDKVRDFDDDGNVRFQGRGGKSRIDRQSPTAGHGKMKVDSKKAGWEQRQSLEQGNISSAVVVQVITEGARDRISDVM